MMVAQRTRLIGRWPAAKVFIAACGIAGCTGGPTVQTADQGTTVETVSVVETVETEAAAEAEAPTLRERWRYVFKKPVWLERLVQKDEEPVPVDPFAVAQREHLERNLQPFVDYTPVVVRPVAQYQTGVDWSRDAVRIDGLMPKWFSDGTPSDATPVTVEGQRRGNPFVDAERRPFRDGASFEQDRTVVQPTSWNAPSGENAAGMAPAASQERAVPIRDYLGRSEGMPAGIMHRDMIIDSSLVKPRISPLVQPVSAEIEPQSPVTPHDTPPRRPFGEPSWEEPESQPTASANRPMSVTPEIPRAAERVSFSSDRVRIDRTPLFSGRDLYRESGTNENAFAAVEGKAAGSDQKETTSASVRHAAAPVVAGRPPIPNAGTSLTVNESETAAPLANALDLSDAKRLAKTRSRSSTIPQFGTPVAVGLGLAAVAAGVIMIRGRLA